MRDVYRIAAPRPRPAVESCSANVAGEIDPLYDGMPWGLLACTLLGAMAYFGFAVVVLSV